MDNVHIVGHKVTPVRQTEVSLMCNETLEESCNTEVDNGMSQTGASADLEEHLSDLSDV